MLFPAKITTSRKQFSCSFEMRLRSFRTHRGCWTVVAIASRIKSVQKVNVQTFGKEPCFDKELSECGDECVVGTPFDLSDHQRCSRGVKHRIIGATDRDGVQFVQHQHIGCL